MGVTDNAVWTFFLVISWKTRMGFELKKTLSYIYIEYKVA